MACRGSCIYHLELGVCFDEYNYHDFLQALFIELNGHLSLARKCTFENLGWQYSESFIPLCNFI